MKIALEYDNDDLGKYGIGIYRDGVLIGHSWINDEDKYKIFSIALNLFSKIRVTLL